MLLKTSIKRESGVSKVAIIIVVVIIILALVAGVVAFVLINNKKQLNQQNTNLNTMVEDSSWDTETEITLEEKNDLKENYLGVFALGLSNKFQNQSDEEILMEEALQFVSKNNTATTTTTSENSTQANQLDNTISTNTISSSQGTQTVVNDTIVITGDNPLSTTSGQNNGTENTTNSTVSSNSAIPNMNINDNANTATTTSSNSATSSNGPDSFEIALAMEEINGKKAENVSDLLSQRSKNTNIIPGYVTDIVSMSKENGIYDITFKVCWPTKADLVEYGTMKKINTAAIDRLESTIVNIQLVRNRDFEYSQYKVKSIEEIGKETKSCYYLSYSTTSNKYGVIDQSGNTIVQNLYDWVDIPNNYKDIFVCTQGTDKIVLNKEGEQIYKDFDNIIAVRSSDGVSSMWYEKDFLIFERDGKYGAIDYDGYEILEPIYDNINPLYYIEGKIIVEESGKLALADVTGKVISNFKYTEIGLLGGQFTLDSMVNSQRTLEQVQAMVQSGNKIIVGKDANGTVEIIEEIKADKVNNENTVLPTINYPSEINGWSQMNINGVIILYGK